MIDKHPLTDRPWNGRCAITGLTLADFEERLQDCPAPDWAKRAAVSICRSYRINGLCDPAYIANTIADDYNSCTQEK